MPEREAGPDTAGLASFGASAWRAGSGWRVSTGNGRQCCQQGEPHALVFHHFLPAGGTGAVVMMPLGGAVD